MKIIVFFRYIFTNFSRLITLNILILIVAGILDSTAILSLTPVIDVLVNTDVEKMSTITRKIIAFLGTIGVSASLTNLLLIFILFNTIRSFLIIFSRYFILNTKYALLRNIILGTFDDFFKARWFFFSNSKQGTLLNTFMREITVVGDAFGAMAGFFAQIVQCMLFLVVPFFLSWQISLIALASAALFALPFGLVGRTTYRLGKMNTATANEIGSVIQESLGSAKLITGFGNQGTSLGYLAKAFDAHRNVTIKSQTLEAAVPLLYYPLGIVVLAIILVSSKYFTVPLSEVVAMLYSFLRIIMLVGTMAAQKNSLNNFFPSYEQVTSLRQHARDLKQKTGTRVYAGMKKGIVLRDVSFSYPDNELILKDINVEIKKGSMVAIVGRSGSGKSTLIDIVMGFNEPQHGRITIDDFPLYDFDIDSYRKCIGYVPQDSVLFNMSIYDNLRWANETATDDEIRDACAIANASDFIEKFPDGYNTLTGDRGVRLSGGQIQRIALARAILRNPDTLILDEATSSLDTESERLIQQAIENVSKKMTVIVIAHRLSTIVNADYIYVMDDGRIVEEGSYEELVMGKGSFNRLHVLAAEQGGGRG
jgi:ABC-type multidrug transport system fused ATPase/permease subunit